MKYGCRGDPKLMCLGNPMLVCETPLPVECERPLPFECSTPNLFNRSSELSHLELEVAHEMRDMPSYFSRRQLIVNSLVKCMLN